MARIAALSCALLLALAASPARARPEPRAASPPPASTTQSTAVLNRYLTLRDARFSNLTVFYRVAGDPSSPVLLMLHGFPSSSHEYARIMPHLATRFYVVAPDFPGFGLTDQPSPAAFNYTFDNLASVTQAFADQLGLREYVLFVHDYGGPVGWRLAVAQPQRVRGFVVQNANAYRDGLSPGFAPLVAYWTDPTNRTNELAARQLLTLAVTENVFYKAGARDPSAIAPEAWIYDQYFLDRPGNDEVQLALFRDYRTNLEQLDALHQYFRQYQPPMLVAWGKKDPFFTLEAAYAYQRDLPKAKVVLFDTGHEALEEDGQGVVREVLSIFA